MYCNSYNPYVLELYHHGILGQKWGVRRWQYEDGTLTPEGRKRYRNDNVHYDLLGRISDAYGTRVANAVRSKKKNPGFVGKLRNYAASEISNFYKSDANLRNYIFGKEYDKNVARWQKSKIGEAVASTIISGALGAAIAPLGGYAANKSGNPAVALAVTAGTTAVAGILGAVGGYQVKQYVERMYDAEHEDDD